MGSEQQKINQIINSPEPTPVTISPNLWHSLNTSVASYDQGSITPETYQSLLNDPDSGVKHADGSPLTDSELLATFEALQDTGLIAKDTENGSEDVYKLNKPATVAPAASSPKPIGYGSARSSSWIKRSTTERGHEIKTRATRYAGNTRTVGSIALGLRPLREAKPSKKQSQTESSPSQETKTDREWAAQRLTQLVLGYDTQELTNAKERIYSSVPDPYAQQQQMYAQQPNNQQRQSGRESRQGSAETSVKDALGQMERSPQYAQLLDPDNLHRLHRDIQDEARPEYDASLEELNAELAADGKDTLSRLPETIRKSIVRDVSDRLTRRYVGVDVPTVVIEALTVRRLQIEDVLKKNSNKPKRP